MLVMMFHFNGMRSFNFKVTAISKNAGRKKNGED